MAGSTTNYGLTKPTQNEFYNVDVQNGNVDIIDGKLKEHATSLLENTQNITTNTSNISAINTDKTNQQFLNVRGVRYNG